MRIRLVRLDDLSGDKATFYSVYLNDDNTTLIKRFFEKYNNSLKSETIEIYNRLIVMGTQTGARYFNFKHEEGNPGDMVCALFDKPSKKLRLYCIRYSERLVILGSGGIKPKNISALQDDPTLKRENSIVVQVAKLIKSRMEEGEIRISRDYDRFFGAFELKDDYYEE